MSKFSSFEQAIKKDDGSKNVSEPKREEKYFFDEEEEEEYWDEYFFKKKSRVRNQYKNKSNRYHEDDDY